MKATTAAEVRLHGRRPVPAYVETAARTLRYRREVFIAPFWPEIYRTDAQRRQTPAEARRTYEVVLEAYTRAGYTLVELPRVAPPERLRFVLERLGHPSPP
jgi:predicted ATPase